MTRLAKGRSTHLSADEIAREALRQMDSDPLDLSIRRLAEGLQVTPSAIYHHFESRTAIIQAVVNLMWDEVNVIFVGLVPDPFQGDPRDVLVGAGIAVRRTLSNHYRVAPYATVGPDSSEALANMVALAANLFERLGLIGDEAATAFYSYASFTIGSSLYASTRRTMTEQTIDPGTADTRGRVHFSHDPHMASLSTDATRAAFDEMMDISIVDPARDEELFAAGLRRLTESFAPAAMA